VCPACLAFWKPLLSIVGVTLALNENQHAWLLYGALVFAFGAAVWDFRRSGAFLPFGLTIAGGGLMIVSHLAGDAPALEWTGVLVMATAMLARMHGRVRHHPGDLRVS
jgi:hypothetical protein